MNIESLLFAFAVGWGIWMLIRIHRKRGGGRGALVDDRKPEQQQNTAREMPRIGEPGTITENQARALRRNNFAPDKQWSFEEAALVLDAVVYLRTVCRDVADKDDGPPPLEIQNELLRLILTEQNLRDYIRKWGETRREEGSDTDDDPDLPRNNQYDRVVEAAREHLAP